jgi:hypothetical protein
MFVDVPFACRRDAAIAEIVERIAAEYPGDLEARASGDDQVVVGAAQALLDSDWSGNALVVGGPGQGKSTLLQYVCQFHRSRMLGEDSYSGDRQHLPRVTRVTRAVIRLDLRRYAEWAATKPSVAKKEKRAAGAATRDWRSIEQYVASEMEKAAAVTFSRWRI